MKTLVNQLMVTSMTGHQAISTVDKASVSKACNNNNNNKDLGGCLLFPPNWQGCTLDTNPICNHYPSSLSLSLSLFPFFSRPFAAQSLLQVGAIDQSIHQSHISNCKMLSAFPFSLRVDFITRMERRNRRFHYKGVINKGQRIEMLSLLILSCQSSLGQTDRHTPKAIIKFNFYFTLSLSLFALFLLFLFFPFKSLTHTGWGWDQWQMCDMKSANKSSNLKFTRSKIEVNTHSTVSDGGCNGHLDTFCILLSLRAACWQV